MKSIATYPLAALCGLVMVGSLFLTWIKISPTLLGFPDPGGASLSLEGLTANIQTEFGPQDLIAMDGYSIETMMQEPLGIAVAASFLFAAAVAILGFLGGMVPRFFAIIGGILPFAIIGYAYYDLSSQIPEGIPFPVLGDGSVMDKVNQAREIMAPGAYAYIGGAALLLLLGILSPSKR